MSPSIAVSINHGQPPSLTKRASLTFLSRFLSQVASLFAGIVVTPIVVHGLGAELYGAWAVLQRAASFTTGLGNLNSCSALKLRLTSSQHCVDVALKRRWIGATIVMWMVTSPAILIAGWFIACHSNSLVQIPIENRLDIQWAVLILVIASPLGTLLSIPSVALRAENLDYRAMGLNAALVLGSGSLNAISVALGYGVIGLAITNLLGIVVISVARWYVAYHAISWLGVNLPKTNELIALAKLSGWVTALSATSFFMSTYDVMLVGYFFGPTEAAAYSLTGTVARLLSTPVSQLLSSANAGIASLVGKKDWEKVTQIRVESHRLAIVLLGVIGAGILALNESFMRLWVGQRFYGGNTLNILFFLGLVARQVYSIEANLVDLSLRLGVRSWLTVACAVAGVAIGVLQRDTLGDIGIAAGVATSYTVLAACMLGLSSYTMSLSVLNLSKTLARPYLAVGICVTISAFVAPFVQPTSWLQFTLIAFAITFASCVYMCFVAIDRSSRMQLKGRLGHLLARPRKSAPPA